MQALHYSVVLIWELSRKAKLLVVKLMFLLILTNGHESWVMTKKVWSQMQGHNDTLPSVETKPRADNLTIANLYSYPLSCTDVNMDDSIKCLSQRHKSALCPAWALN